jgi:hypothetical protein
MTIRWRGQCPTRPLRPFLLAHEENEGLRLRQRLRRRRGLGVEFLGKHVAGGACHRRRAAVRRANLRGGARWTRNYGTRTGSRRRTFACSIWSRTCLLLWGPETNVKASWPMAAVRVYPFLWERRQKNTRTMILKSSILHPHPRRR